MTENRSPYEWEEAYVQLRPTYEALVDKLKVLLETLVADAELEFNHAFSWTLSPSEFVECIFRERRATREVDDPLAEWTDFAGVTLVVTCADDLEPLLTLVEQEFEVDVDASTSFLDAAAANDQLGLSSGEEKTEYAFPYLVVSLPASRTTSSEWRPYEGLRVRVEVQTLFQSAWETIDQDELPYHRDSSYPDSVQLAISDAARRFAAADDAIGHIRHELDRADERYAEAISHGTLALELNARSLAAYLKASDTARELVGVGERVGMTPDETDAGAWQLEQILLWLLPRIEVGSIAELDAFLSDALGRAEDIFGDLTRIAGARGTVPWAGSGSVVVLLVLVLMRADSETVALASFVDEIEYAVNTLIGNPTSDLGPAG